MSVLRGNIYAGFSELVGNYTYIRAPKRFEFYFDISAKGR